MAFTPVAHSADPTWTPLSRRHYVPLANGSFEDGEVVAVGWTLESRWEWAEGAPAQDGDKYMRFSRPMGGDAQGDLISVDEYHFAVGKTYRLTCSALKKGAGTAMAIQIGGAHTQRIIATKQVWQSISWDFTVPFTGDFAVIVTARTAFGFPAYPIMVDNIQIEKLTGPLWDVIARSVGAEFIPVEGSEAPDWDVVEPSADPNWTEVIHP